jgi:excisionase family DNA binding protein
MNLDSLTAVEVAKLLDVTEKTIRNWMNDNDLPSQKAGRGRTLQWREVLKWYVAYMGGNDGNSVKKPAVTAAEESYDEAILRKTVAEADIKELELAEMRREVASIGDIEKLLTAANLATRTQVEALPSRLSVQLVAIPEQKVIHGIIHRETSQLLTNLATIDSVFNAIGTAEGR